MGRVTIDKCGKIEKWDAWRGMTEEVDVDASDGKSIEFSIALKRRESIVFVVDVSYKPAIMK